MGYTGFKPYATWVVLLSVFVVVGCSSADAADPNDANKTTASGLVAPDLSTHLSALNAALGDSQGIYSLQASLRFDSLQTVVYDPDNKALTLLGNRRDKRWLAPIPYLDHLATALEGGEPKFTLPWSEAAKRQTSALMRESAGSNTALWDRIVKNARSRLFDEKGLLTKQGLRILNTLPFPTKGFQAGVTNKYEVMAKTFHICGGEQQATLIGAYGRSLREPKQLDAAIREVAMSRVLDATMTSQYSARMWERFLKRFAGVFDVDEEQTVNVFRRARQDGDSIVAARNAAVEHVLTAIDPVWKKIFSNSLELSSAEKPHIHLPPDLVRSLAGITISVKPTWYGVSPESRLAEVLFDADLLLKWIVSDPSLLGSNLPSHLTEVEWNKKRGNKPSKAATNNVRFWISPAAVELAESRDGSVLEIRKVKLRVNTNDPASRAYANYLTSIFDELADEIPTLHELVECTKIVAVAQWLKKKDSGFRLSKEGRSRWEPPAWVFGFISISCDLRVNRTDSELRTRITGKWTGHATLEGGVSLALGKITRVDHGVLFDGSRGARLDPGSLTFLVSNAPTVVALDEARRIVVPAIYDNQALKNVLRKKTVPPPPRPPGATAQATLGKRKLAYIQVLRGRLGGAANAETIQRALEEATILARKLQFSDKLINDLQAGRINAQEAFRRAEQWARAEREQFVVDMIDTVSGGLSEWLLQQRMLQFKTEMAQLLYAKHRYPRHWLMLSNRYGPQSKTLLKDINTAKNSIRSGDHFERHLATVTRSVDLLAEINKEITNGPGSKVLGRAPLYSSVAADSLKASYKILETHYNIKQVEVLSEQLGREAQFLNTLQKRREAQVKQLKNVINWLEQNASK